MNIIEKLRTEKFGVHVTTEKEHKIFTSYLLHHGCIESEDGVDFEEFGKDTLIELGKFTEGEHKGKFEYISYSKHEPSDECETVLKFSDIKDEIMKEGLQDIFGKIFKGAEVIAHDNPADFIEEITGKSKGDCCPKAVNEFDEKANELMSLLATKVKNLTLSNASKKFSELKKAIEGVK